MSDHPVDPPHGSDPDRPDPRSRAAAPRLDPFDPRLLDRLGITIPDDARALEAERAALFGAPPAPWWRRIARALRPRGGLAGPLASMVLLCVLIAGLGVVSTMMGALIPRMDLVRPPDAAPLASAPVTTPGAEGGLLPDTGVQVDGTARMSARDLRPAVLFHPPTGISPAVCEKCADQLEAWWRQAGEYGLGVYVVVPPDRVAEAARLTDAATQGAARVVADPSGALVSAYGDPNTATAVLVHSDGVVGQVVQNPSPDGRFEQVLSPLRRAGVPPTVRSVDPAATA